MAKSDKRLSPLAVQRKGVGTHPDGRGLYLQVTRNGERVSRSWLFRFTFNGKARWMGLGPVHDVSLAEAREAARVCRQKLREGIDPIEERKARKQAAKIEAAKSISFKECAERYIAAHRPGWRNPKHAAQWSATLKAYAYPVFGDLPVQAIDTALVMKALTAIWTDKPETATRVRQRIEAVLSYATAHEWRRGENPAQWRGHIENLLPKRSRVAKVEHFKAMPYADLPDFFTELRARDTVSARALAFTILTAARSGETRGATAEEFDRDAGVWTVPGSRTKSGREHRVPLSPEAMAIVEEAWPETGLLFPNGKGTALTDTAMRKYLQNDLERRGVTVHGFRSSFRDWVADKTSFPRELAEMALAHVIRDATEAAYHRSDVIERRRELMEAWGRYCVSFGSPVVQLQIRAS